MKTTSILFGLIVGLLLVILFPYLFYSASNYFDLFVVDYYLLKIVGVILILIGGSLFLYCSKLFKIIGRGTPVPIEPPKKIVQQGLYQHVRNPMYLGYFAIVLGEAMFLGAALLFAYTVVFILITHIYVIYFEEQDLKKRFGSSYDEYTKQVPRWMPKINNKQ